MADHLKARHLDTVPKSNRANSVYAAQLRDSLKVGYKWMIVDLSVNLSLHLPTTTFTNLHYTYHSIS